MRDTLRPARSRRFRSSTHGRFWWHKLADTDYVPAIYQALSDEEWALVESWYAETEAAGHIGEINVPAISLMYGLISGSAVRRVVQLGHYYGYSSLILGFLLRAMDARPGLFSIDISREATRFTEKWIERARLGDYVSLFVGDSAAETSVQHAEQVLEGPPQLIIVDSSHQYAHTLRELEIWVPRMPVGGLMLFHDTSRFAQAWDSTGEGGVLRALQRWLPDHPEVGFVNLNGFADANCDGNSLVYKDACGLGLLQKYPGAAHAPAARSRSST